MKPTKRMVDTVVSVMESSIEYDSPAQMAEKLIEIVWDFYEARAKYVVVGQLYRDAKGAYLNPGDTAADKICIGNFATPGDAKTAALALTHGVTGESFRTWVVPMEHTSPAAFYKARKKAAGDADADEKAKDFLAKWKTAIQKQYEDRMSVARDDAEREVAEKWLAWALAEVDRTQEANRKRKEEQG